MQTESGPEALMERLRRALNRHDLEAMLECFDPDYRSEQPLHPNRGFDGKEQVRTNWSQIFDAVPDIEATLLRSASEGDTVWAEWEWKGTHADGAPFAMRGVTIQGVRQGRIVWARLYVEPVEEDGEDIDEAVRSMTGG